MLRIYIFVICVCFNILVYQEPISHPGISALMLACFLALDVWIYAYRAKETVILHYSPNFFVASSSFCETQKMPPFPQGRQTRFIIHSSLASAPPTRHPRHLIGRCFLPLYPEALWIFYSLGEWEGLRGYPHG